VQLGGNLVKDLQDTGQQAQIRDRDRDSTSTTAFDVPLSDGRLADDQVVWRGVWS
jgi:hypothetical protein